MREERWTFLCLRDGDSPIRQFSLSTKVIHYFASAAGGVFLVLSAFATLAVLDGGARIEARELSRANRTLQDELATIQGRVSGLEASLGKLTEQDARYRMLAGLNAIDDEVFQVGVGGPGLPKPETSPLWEYDRDTGERTFAVSYDILALQRRARLLSESLAEASDSLSSRREQLLATPSILPTDGLLSSPFSLARFHPILQKELPHPGVDISAPKGTPILAAAKGRITYAGWRSGYGNTIEIDHGFGYMTRYGHASEILVKAGQVIERGETIAKVGMTGLATNPNLHYEIWVGGEAQDPMNFIISWSSP
jgi:murein DD-endopeptidase MepM/ murein hydrolase activator NlpD